MSVTACLGQLTIYFRCARYRSTKGSPLISDSNTAFQAFLGCNIKSLAP